tara:strand:- start:690 stop:887 length:198 start_codon:yes stop_codon:yes gene_type:complete
MNLRFRNFIFIILGIFIIGFSVGWLYGFFINELLSNRFIPYISVVGCTLGSLLIIYGALYKRKIL